MPTVRQYDVTLADLGNGFVSLHYDGVDETHEATQFFPGTETFDENQFLHNLRLVYQITNQSDPTSTAFRHLVNTLRGGVKCSTRTAFLSSVTQIDGSDPIRWQIQYGYSVDDASYGTQVDAEWLAQSDNNSLRVVANIGSFLRVNGFSSMTAEAIAAVNATKFRGYQ